MKRRDLLKFSALTATAATLKATPSYALFDPELTTPSPEQVKRVLIVSLCHLDVGFIATQAKIMRKYFDVYYPEAIKTCAALRAQGKDRYVWTTPAWLLYEYLEQASAEQRKVIEKSIAAGDLNWHAMPFNWQTEMVDPSMMKGCFGFCATLDSRFGHKTVGARMGDVPGHTRGIISPLAEAGVKLLDIGVNAASTPPEVPDVFLWKDPNGASLVMMYHHHNYGGVIQIPGTDTAIAMEVRNDNSGPHHLDEIVATYTRLKKQFPNATIHASNMSEVADATDAVRNRLPIVTQEIGDTWIYGVPSDPYKVARYREAARLRQQWVRQKKFAAGDKTDLQFLRRFSLAIEHTWGTDTKTYLDNDHYKPADLKQVINTPPYQTMITSWKEKRDDIDEGVAALPAPLRAEVEERFKQLTPATPTHNGLQALTAKHEITAKHFVVGIDPKTGAITRLQNRATGKEWASAEHPLALFTYQTLSAQDFANYLNAYVLSKADWAPRDFGKPNIGHFGALSKEWHPTIVHAWAGAHDNGHRIVLELKIDDAKTAATGLVAWPATMYLEITLPDAEPAVHLKFSSFGKEENRLPESLWLTFNPAVGTPSADHWLMEKSGQPVRASDVVRGGARHMHAITEKLRYNAGQHGFEIATLDAPVVAFGDRSPLNYSPNPPDVSSGVHVNLFNNAWGTNYIQWCGGDWAYRFTLRG
ncbi:MAG TPA: DUF5054 domain-containing protein [Edaphobacter sp.]|nr:DUF5054 domain-containing protein [Edaphobacter sp.]